MRMRVGLNPLRAVLDSALAPGSDPRAGRFQRLHMYIRDGYFHQRTAVGLTLNVYGPSEAIGESLDHAQAATVPASPRIRRPELRRE